ncbi:MAG: helix-turn-helix domain-containing protein [Christensenellales bacterium]
MTTGERIRERRDAIGMSAEKLAEKIGIAKTTIYRYEKGTIEKVPIDTIDAIAYILQTTPAYLLGKTDDPGIEPVELMQGAGKTHWMSLQYHTEAYGKMLDSTAAFLKELQKNPKLALLFDKSKKLNASQYDAILNIIDEIIGERDGT